ncbi:MAG: pyrroline-5-carboxylate reductase [Thermacetogeniaceae bacterium]
MRRVSKIVNNKKIGVIGTGAMGSALIRGFLKAGLVEPCDVTASDVNNNTLQKLKEQFSVNAAVDNVETARNSEIVIVAVKPGQVKAVLEEITPVIKADHHLIISVAAGVKISFLEENLPAGTPVIRVMPNVPSLAGEGMSALVMGSCAVESHQKVAEALFAAVGRVIVVSEKEIDAVTAVSGCGPAYLAIVLEALADGGVKMGLSRQVALELAAQTMIGTGRMVLNGEHPAVLKDRVCSPGGSTISGVHVLEKGGLRGVLLSAVEAATKRSGELQ